MSNPLKETKRAITPRLPEETHWEFARLAKLWQCSIPVAIEISGHMAGAMCRESVDEALLDMARTRKREAYIDMSEEKKAARCPQ